MGSLPTSLDDEHRLRYSFEVKPEYFSTFEDARDKMQKIEGIMEMIAITVTKKPGHQHHGTTIESANVDGTAMHEINSWGATNPLWVIDSLPPPLILCTRDMDLGTQSKAVSEASRCNQ